MLISESIQKISFSYEPDIYIQSKIQENPIQQISELQSKNTEDFFQENKNFNQQNDIFPLEKYNSYMRGSFLDVYA